MRNIRFTALLGLLLLAAAGALDNVLQFRHTLANHGAWSPVRNNKAQGAGGGFEFLRARPSLRGNRLDLRGRGGFNGVLYLRPLEPRVLEFDFLLESRSLTVLFNKSPEAFEGVRLDAPSGGFYFAADAGGRFRRRVPLENAAVRDGWNRFSAVSTEHWIEVKLNGAPAGTLPARFTEGLLGFRGSAGAASVDNVRIEGPGGRVLVDETFHHWRGLKGGMWALAALLAAAAFALAWFWRTARGAARAPSRFAVGASRGPGLSDGVGREGKGPLLAAALLAAAQWAFAAVNFAYLSGIPPSPDKLHRPAARAEGGRARDTLADQVLSRHGAEPPPGVTRVLFLGTSQTWGPGVPPEQTFAARLERELNAAGRGRYECVNASVAGEDPQEIIERYEKEWRALGARLVVVNLSPVGDDPDSFRPALGRLLALNRSLGVRTLLVVEPRSYPRPRWSAAAKELARESGVPLVDLQERLASARDEGILWFDRSHLTPAGHELAFEAMLGPVLEGLR
jgi:hypothetical protein